MERRCVHRTYRCSRMKKFSLNMLFVLSLLLQPIIAEGDAPAQVSGLSVQEACMLELINTAPDKVTIGEARARCGKRTTEAGSDESVEQTRRQTGAVEERLDVDETNILKPFTLMSHRNNYILLAAHNFQGWEATQNDNDFEFDGADIDDTEVQFQLSIKAPLAINLFDQGLDIFTAYTVRSFWQLYNGDNSSPFRETNHEPELWLQIRPDWKILGFKNTVSALGINHQSNGKGGELSRSWNRIYAGFGFERNNFAFLLRPWIRIQENSQDDDNPDITDYYGHGELWAAYKYKDHTFSFMSRNNIESGFSRGAVELGWSFPLLRYNFLKGYLQYFSGYGESLIDYDHYVNRIGIGLQLTDLL